MEERDYETEVMDIIGDDKFFRLPISFVKKFGYARSAYLVILINWKKFIKRKYNLPKESPFFITQERIEQLSFLTKTQQIAYNEKFSKEGIISIERYGSKRRNNYVINFEKLYSLILKPLDPIEPDSEEEALEIGKPNTLCGNGTLPQEGQTEVRKPYHSIIKIIEEKEDLDYKVFSYEKTVGSCDPSNSIKPKLLSRGNKSPITFFPIQPHRKDVSKIIDYWNASPGLSHHRTGTKTFEQIIKTVGEVIDGQFLRDWPAYPVEEIIYAIDGYKIRLTNPDYSPINKDTMKPFSSLSNFFWNPYTATSSMFLECLNNPPTLLKNTIPKEKEVNPQLTQWLEKFYIDKILLGQPKVFNQQEVNKFIKGANLLSSSIPNLRERANLTTGPMEFCEYVIDALIEQFPKEEIKPGNIGSEWTYNELLPKYLSKIGRID